MREDQLHTFVAAAESGSLTSAARALGMTQSAVSRRIAALEKEVGAALFRRTPDGVTLTPAGRAYMRRIPAIRTAMRAVSDAARDVAG